MTPDMMTRLAALERRVAQLEGKSAPPSSDADIAPDSDLDGKYGDPEVRSNPREWDGPSMVGKRFSECEPEFLDELAGRLQWIAAKAEQSGETTTAGKPRAPLIRRDAARARGWAQRIRDGWAT